MNGMKRSRPDARPFHLMTKPIGPICNLDCAYCYYLSKEALYPSNETYRMSDSLLETYIRQMIEAQPGPRVDFAWQGGEPTLMGIDFFRRAVALQQRYLPPGWTCTNALQTNGTLLTPEWCDFLREHHFLVGISIDGPEELHDAYRRDKGGHPTHRKVMQGLQLLQRHNVEHNVLCVVNHVNARHPLDIYRFFRDAGVAFVQYIPIVEHLGEGRVSGRSVDPEDYGRFLIATFDEWVRRDVGRMYIQIIEESLAVWSGYPASLCIFRETCGSALAMEHNGDVYACDHFVFPDYKLGNITEEPLRHLVDLPSQRRFGEDKRDRLPAVCRTCDVRFICNGGCPKDRFLRTPDGEEGLNYLCAGYRLFFRHIDPIMREMAGFLNRGIAPATIMKVLRDREARKWRSAGRNDPCPCGSGAKYKRCCYPRRAL